MATAQKLTGIVNGVNVDDLFNTIDVMKTTPSSAKFNFRIRNEWQGASRNCSMVSEFHGAGRQQDREKTFVLMADEPAVLLGKDSAANPVEHLLHALASCLTTSMVYHAAARGIEIEEVESTLEGDIDLHGFLDLDPEMRKGYQGIRAKFKIKAKVPDEKLHELAELGTDHSPVFDSLTRGVPVFVSTERF
jgi:uncharacterized OsmC-like protein